MKNKSVFKVFGIMLLVTFLLTWIIPSSIVSGGITIGKISPVGIADIFSSIEVLSTYFLYPTVFILFVGMFYGVANESGSFKALVNKIVSIFKNKKNLFVVLTVLFYGLTTALTGIYIPVFMFIPLSVAVLFGLKYNKVQSILATVGASSVGLAAQLFNASIKNLTGAQTDKFIWVKVGLLVVLLALTILYIIKISSSKNKVEKDAELVMFVPESRSASKKVTTKGISLFVIITLLFIVFVLGLTPWNTTIFTNIYDAIKGVKIGNFAIFASILGSFETFGSWSYNSVYATIGLSVIALSIANHLSFKEMVESAINGAKKLSGIAILVALISLILVFTLNSGFMGTVINFIAKSGNIALVALSSLVSVPFMVDLNYALQYILSALYYTTNNQDMLTIFGLIIQFTFGFAALIAPSSLLLMAGLSYVEEEYSKWFKYIWKFLLAVLVAVLVAIAVVALI